MTQSGSFWQNLPKPISILAPMEEVTDRVFRSLIREAAPPQIYMSEFAACNGIIAQQEESLRRASLSKEEHNELIIAQIWGPNPQEYHDVIPILIERGFKGVDINMGCPDKKITKKGCCSALINNPSLAEEIIQATKEGVVSTLGCDSKTALDRFPVSVKTRIGFSKVVTETWCGHLLDQGIAALTVHGRTTAQQSEGSADWNEIKKVVKLRNQLAPETLIIGNGDIHNHYQIQSYPDRYGVDGLMIGRGIFQNPLIFSSFHSTKDPRHFSELPSSEQIAWALRHLNRYRKEYEGKRNYEILKKFFKIYIFHFPGADELRDKIMQTHDYDSATKLLKSAM
jgi:nifR3 family TIM-barrel protein